MLTGLLFLAKIMEKSYIDTPDLDGVYSSLEEFFQAFRREFNRYNQAPWREMEIRLNTEPYEGTSISFYGLDRDKLDSVESGERAEYLRLHEKYGSTS